MGFYKRDNFARIMNKETLRRIFLEKRNQLTVKERNAFSQILFSQVIQLRDQSKPKNIHLFLPQLSSSEPNTNDLIAMVRKVFPKIEIVVPYIIPKSKKLKHFILEEDTELTFNQWNIPEPNPLITTPIDPKELDMIILPLLAFDKKGFRVGYGGGYYDRFLTECTPETLKIGLSYFEPIEAISDLNEYDIKMDFCVTPYQFYRLIIA